MAAWTALLSLALIAIPASAESQMERIQKLAASGQIQEKAAVKASSEIVVRASSESVWTLLTSLGNWPEWGPEISMAKINGPLEPGTTFEWRTGGAKIESRIALVRPTMQLAWTGTAYKARAIHVWN